MGLCIFVVANTARKERFATADTPSYRRLAWKILESIRLIRKILRFNLSPRFKSVLAAFRRCRSAPLRVVERGCSLHTSVKLAV